MNPERPSKPRLGGSLTKNPFLLKIVFIVGGGAVFMLVLFVVVTLFFGSKTNVTDFVSLAATEQEIIRVSAEGKNATDQNIQNAAINTQVTLKTHQQAWITFLKQNGQKTDSKILGTKKNSDTDAALKEASQTSTFDTVYVATMREQLVDYGNTIKTTYDRSSSTTARETLNSQYEDVALLLEQWPKE